MKLKIPKVGFISKDFYKGNNFDQVGKCRYQKMIWYWLILEKQMDNISVVKTRKC